MFDLFVVGAGGLGRGLVDILVYDKNKHIDNKYNNIYFVDDNIINKNINGIAVRYSLNEFLNITEKCLVLNAMGDPIVREKIQDKLNKNNNFEFPNFIDSDIKISPNVKLGKGNIITRGTVLSTNISIGDFNLIHYNSTIGHDVVIGDFNCIYPLTSLSGYTRIGNNNMIGTGVASLPQSSLGDFVRVGANSLISGDYSSNITVVGSPAKLVNKN